MATARIFLDIKRWGHSKPPAVQHATVTRYPSTYARDYVRNHPDVIGWEPENRNDFGDRGAAGTAIRDYSLRTHQGSVDVFLALADAYLDEHNLVMPPGTIGARVHEFVLQEEAYWTGRHKSEKAP